MPISESIRESKRKYDKKRAEGAQFQRQYITDEYAKKIDELAKIYGTKKAVLLAGVDELYKKVESENKS